MFKAVEERPYPETRLTTLEWLLIRPRHVPIHELIATQNHLRIAALDPAHHGSRSGDRLVHVIQWEGRLYLEDGHHRVVRERIAGADWVNARVLNLDHAQPPPTGEPAVAAEVGADVPGLVWVEGKGYRAVHLARALQSTGRTVDWSRWSEGTPAELKPLQYRDMA